LSRGSNKGEHGKDPDPTADDAEEKDDGFPTSHGCLMIFGGSEAYDSKRRQTDHPESVSQPGRYPLVIDPIVGMKCLTKVLMDGGNSLNILYAETLDAMGIDRARVQPTGAPFHGIVPGKQALPLG
jgi:hypothetical protein